MAVAEKEKETEVVQEAPISRFASSFKAYGIGLGVILAAVPVGTTALNLLPAYDSLKNGLSFFTTLVSYLAVALLFGIRRLIGKHVFPTKRYLTGTQMWRRKAFSIWVPVVLMGTSVVSVVVYGVLMSASVKDAALQFTRVTPEAITLAEKEAAIRQSRTAPARDEEAPDNAKDEKTPARVWNLDDYPMNVVLAEYSEGFVVKGQLFGLKGPDSEVTGTLEKVVEEGETSYEPRIQFNSEKGIAEVLARTPSFEVPKDLRLKMFYVLMFISAVASFVWFGIIEYVQQELGITDADLLREPYQEAASHMFRIDEVKDMDENPALVHFAMSYDPDAFEHIGLVRGPICSNHQTLLVPTGLSSEHGGKAHTWACHTRVKDKVQVLHNVNLPQDAIEVTELAAKQVSSELEQLAARKKDASRTPDDDEES